MKFTGITSARFVGGLLTALILAVVTPQSVTQIATESGAQSQLRTGYGEAYEITLYGKNVLPVRTSLNNARHSGNSWVELNGGVQ